MFFFHKVVFDRHCRGNHISWEPAFSWPAILTGTKFWNKKGSDGIIMEPIFWLVDHEIDEPVGFGVNKRRIFHRGVLKNLPILLHIWPSISVTSLTWESLWRTPTEIKECQILSQQQIPIGRSTVGPLLWRWTNRLTHRGILYKDLVDSWHLPETFTPHRKRAQCISSASNSFRQKIF